MITLPETNQILLTSSGHPARSVICQLLIGGNQILSFVSFASGTSVVFTIRAMTQPEVDVNLTQNPSVNVPESEVRFVRDSSSMSALFHLFCFFVVFFILSHQYSIIYIYIYLWIYKLQPKSLCFVKEFIFLAHSYFEKQLSRLFMSLRNTKVNNYMLLSWFSRTDRSLEIRAEETRSCQPMGFVLIQTLYSVYSGLIKNGRLLVPVLVSRARWDWKRDKRFKSPVDDRSFSISELWAWPNLPGEWSPFDCGALVILPGGT